MAQYLAQFYQNYAPLSENAGFSLLALASIPLFLALYVSLRNARPSEALIGGVFGVLWAVTSLTFLVMRYGAESTSAFLYSTAAPADQALVVAAAEATFYSVYGLFYVAGILASIALIAVGVAMFGTTSFERGYGWMTVVFGILYALSIAEIAFAYSTNPTTQNPGFVILIIVLNAWPIVMGQKLFRLSKVA